MQKALGNDGNWNQLAIYIVLRLLATRNEKFHASELKSREYKKSRLLVVIRHKQQTHNWISLLGREWLTKDDETIGKKYSNQFEMWVPGALLLANLNN